MYLSRSFGKKSFYRNLLGKSNLEISIHMVFTIGFCVPIQRTWYASSMIAVIKWYVEEWSCTKNQIKGKKHQKTWLTQKEENLHCVKSVPIRIFSGLYFPTFGLNTERYSASPRIQSECGKIRTRKTPNTDTFWAVLKSKPPVETLIASIQTL